MFSIAFVQNCGWYYIKRAQIIVFANKNHRKNLKLIDMQCIAGEINLHIAMFVLSVKL